MQQCKKSFLIQSDWERVSFFFFFAFLATVIIMFFYLLLCGVVMLYPFLFSFL